MVIGQFIEPKEIQFKAKLCNVNQLGLLTLKLEDGNEQQFSLKRS